MIPVWVAAAPSTRQSLGRTRPSSPVSALHCPSYARQPSMHPSPSGLGCQVLLFRQTMFRQLRFCRIDETVFRQSPSAQTSAYRILETGGAAGSPSLPSSSPSLPYHSARALGRIERRTRVRLPLSPRRTPTAISLRGNSRSGPGSYTAVLWRTASGVPCPRSRRPRCCCGESCTQPLPRSGAPTTPRPSTTC